MTKRRAASRTPQTPKRAKPKRKFHPEILTDGEVRAILAAANGNTPSCRRNRALIAVLYRCGLRISEALALRLKDIDVPTGRIRVLFGKGGKARTVGIDSGGLALLVPWLEERRSMKVPLSSPVFCTASGRAVTTAYIRRLFPHLARKAGVAKRVHAHGFRHTHASQLREEGIDIGVISKTLGHTSLLTTIIYLDHVAPTRTIEAVANRSWSS